MSRHPESGNARLAAAREAAIDAIAKANGTASIEVRHLQFLVAATEHLNLGDTDPATWPLSNAG